MAIIENFSVYSVRDSLSDSLAHRSAGDDPLHFLRGDPEHGWHVARNLLKPLNHLDFLRRQEEIARQLGLHNVDTPTEVFQANYRLLEDHQRSRLSTSALIDHLAVQMSLGPASVRLLLQEYAAVRHMEFHPTDICNLTCRGCTYGHDNPATKPPPVSFPFGSLPKILGLRPGSIVICGGGEPTLYRDGPRTFPDLVNELAALHPRIRLALVTNGTYLPPGGWPDHLDWVRISLDAATRETYRGFRGRDTFERVIQNFLRYLDFAVPHVGVGMLFSKFNIHEYARVADFLFQLVSREKPHCLPKVNIQYRPLRRDPSSAGRPFDEAITPAQFQAAIQEVEDLARSSPQMEAFLRDQTNITAILGGNTHPPYSFSRCYYSQTFKILRANGDLRPCFIRVMEPEFRLGNLLSDPLETIALNTLYVGAARQPDCDARGCRQCHVNYIFENGLAGKIQPSPSAEVLADPMY
jgi:MoaA/NifB/PqqE/SkfB family radical SAM enzyme